MHGLSLKMLLNLQNITFLVKKNQLFRYKLINFVIFDRIHFKTISN